MSSRIKDLFDEIRQIQEQYQVEVPGKRRAWPKSLRDRVLELRALKVQWKKIAQETGIPITTLHQWRRKKEKPSSFVPVKVGSGTKLRPDADFSKTTTVTVVVEGIRVEGLDVIGATQLIDGIWGLRGGKRK